MTGCAVITGGSRGIGAATAERLARAGHATAVLYRSDGDGAAEVVERIRAAGGAGIAVRADVSQPDQVDAAFDEIEAELGQVAILVNNAGIRADALAANLSDADWDRVLSTNLSAAFVCARRVLKPMLRARYGRIVNVASVVAVRGHVGQANYAASKGGLVAMTHTLGVEVARRGVTVNAVMPGYVPTKLTADVDPDVTRLIPARRAGTADEVAACIAFLASEEASYVTGAVLTVDGGLSA